MAAKGGTHEMLATCTYQCESFYQGVMYGCVFAIASVQLLRIRSRSTELTAQLLFHAFISLFTLIRSVVDELFAFGAVRHDSTVFYILWALPGLLFFSTYSLLVFEWSRVLHEGHHSHDKPRRFCSRKAIVIVCNVFIYIGQAAVFVMLGWPAGSSVHSAFLTAEPDYLAVVALVSCAAFLFYGLHLYHLFARQLWKSKVQQRMVSSIFTVTVFCTLCFLLRGVTNLVWTKTVSTLEPCNMVVFYLVFYFLVEVLPSLAVLWVMRRLPRRVGSTDKLLNRLPAHLQIAKGTSTANQRPLLLNQGYSSRSQQLGPGYSSEFASVTDAALHGFMHSPPPSQRDAHADDPYSDYGGAAHDHQYFAGSDMHLHGDDGHMAMGGSPYGRAHAYYPQQGQQHVA